MDRIIVRFEVVIKRALHLKSGLCRRTIFVEETFVGTHVNVQLVVYIGVRSTYIDHAEVNKIG
jgi:hypothetical protein